jgi:hypothetical protein
MLDQLMGTARNGELAIKISPLIINESWGQFNKYYGELADFSMVHFYL